MIDNSPVKTCNQNQSPQGNPQLDPQNRTSSSNKFLKRKPDHTKLLGSPSSKKNRESSINRILANTSDQDDSHSTLQTESRFITQKKVSRQGSDVAESSLLETARSENNLLMRKKELGMTINRVYEDASKISKDSFFSKNSPKASIAEGISQIDDYNHFATTLRKPNKKSRTEFFNLDQLGLGGDLGKDEGEEPSTQQHAQLSCDHRRLIDQCDSLSKKNKWLEEQMEAYAERQYLLLTQKKFLEEQVREKERRIDALQREALQQKSGGNEVQKWKSEVLAIAARLAREEQRYSNLKEENDYMQTELITKNEQLISLYNKQAEQEARHRKERHSLTHRLEKMRAEVERLRVATADEGGVLGQDKWRERVFRQQQEIKYLQIQNQCLLICKDELGKSESENRKLRDERDYFKQKVMEHIKRNKRLQELSRSENSSIVLELSETSIDHK